LFSPRAGITLKPEETLKIKFSTGQGFKGQALFDEEHLIFHGFYNYRANPDLGFEKSWTYNLDVAHDYDLGFVSGGINFIGYYTTITGRAIPQTDSLAAGTYFPVQSSNPSRLYGIEITTRPVFDEFWSGAIGIGVVKLEHQVAGGSYEEAPLVPGYTVDLSVAYRDIESGWTAETWGSIIGSQKLPEGLFAISRSPAYGLFNARVSKKIGIITIHTGVLNIFDQTQANTTPTAIVTSDRVNSTGVWGPLEGREFFLGFRISM
jgi:outer membrane receptor protein involved in Fe transport